MAPDAIGEAAASAAAAGRKLVSILYADLRRSNGDPERRAHMLDILYLATGLGFFALMAVYARWAGRA